MGAGPIPATEKALRQAGLTIDDIDAFEVNEAFAVQVLAFLEHFGIADDDPRVNPYGGAIAMGHPLASSGVRLMTQLARRVRGAPRGPLRPHHHVHRHRHGRHRDLGEPALDRRGSLTMTQRSTTLLDRAAGDRLGRRARHRGPAPQGRPCPSGAGVDGPDHPRQRRGPHQAQHVRAPRPARAQRRDRRGARRRRDHRDRRHRQAVHPGRRRRPDLDRRRRTGRACASSPSSGHAVFRKLRRGRQAVVRLRQRPRPRRRPRGRAALHLPHRDGLRSRARPARGHARPGPRLGRRLPGAQPGRRRQGGDADPREPAQPGQDARAARRPSSSAWPTRASPAPTTSSSRCSGRPACSTGDGRRRAARGRPWRGLGRGRGAGPRRSPTPRPVAPPRRRYRAST